MHPPPHPPPFSPDFSDGDFEKVVTFIVSIPALSKMEAFRIQIVLQYMTMLSEEASVPLADIACAQPTEAENTDPIQDQPPSHNISCSVKFVDIVRAPDFISKLRGSGGSEMTSSAFVTAFGYAAIDVNSIRVETTLVGQPPPPPAASPPPPSLPPWPSAPPPPHPTPAPTPVPTTPGPTNAPTRAPTPAPTTPSPTVAPLAPDWLLEDLDAAELCQYLAALFFRSSDGGRQALLCAEAGACDDSETGKLCQDCLQIMATLENATVAGLVDQQSSVVFCEEGFLERHACSSESDGGGPCCHKGFQLGYNLCEAADDCRWKAGSCMEDTVCAECRSCLARLEDGLGSAVSAHQGGPSDSLERVVQAEMHKACTSLGPPTDICGGVDWAAWYTGTGGIGFGAGCHMIGLCSRDCLGGSLCPGASATAPADGASVTADSRRCLSSGDCSKDGSSACAPYDGTGECVWEPDPKCDPETGFFQGVTCLGTCVSATEAACTAFDAGWEAQAGDLLQSHSASVLSELSMAALPTKVAQLEVKAAQGLRACNSDNEEGQCASSGQVCSPDSRCSMLLSACDKDAGVYRITALNCSGICSEVAKMDAGSGMQLESVPAVLSPDASWADVSLPVQVSEAEGPATEFFLNGDEVLGKEAHVVASGLSMRISVGNRAPFSPSIPKMQLVITPSAPLAAAKTGANITGTLELTFPVAVATPKPALVQQEGVAGGPCGGASGGAAVIRITPAKGEVWADVAWGIRAVPSGAEAELQGQVALLNSQSRVMDKLALRESRLAVKWPQGSYSLLVTAKNFAGASVETYMTFERSGFALPKIAGLGDLEFRRSQGLEVAPVGSTQGCGELELRYLWMSVDGAMPLSNPEAPFLRIPPNAPWAAPGKVYPVAFVVKTEGGVVVAQDVTDIRCLESPLVASVSGPTVARSDRGLKLEVSLSDPDKAQEPVVYKWACTSSLGSCFSGSRGAEASANSYTVKGDALTPALYTFTVTASKGKRLAVASIEVQVIGGAESPPTGYIELACAGNACSFPSAPVNPYKPLSMTAQVEGTSGGSDPGVAFEWSWDLEGLALSAADVARGSVTEQHLEIMPAGLNKGHPKFQVTVTMTNVTTGGSSKASVEIHIGQAPYCSPDHPSDCLEVAPPEGRALGETVFRAEASGWRIGLPAGQAGSETRFRFGYCSEPGCAGAGARVWLSGDQLQPSFEITSLPQGSPGTNYRRTVVVCAISYIHQGLVALSEACAMQDVRVLPREVLPDPGDLSTSLAGLGDLPTSQALMAAQSAAALASGYSQEEAAGIQTGVLLALGDVLSRDGANEAVLSSAIEVSMQIGKSPGSADALGQVGSALGAAAAKLAEATGGDPAKTQELAAGILGSLGTLATAAGSHSSGTGSGEDERGMAVMESLRAVKALLGAVIASGLVPGSGSTLVQAGGITMDISRDYAASSSGKTYGGTSTGSSTTNATGRRSRKLLALVASPPQVSLPDNMGDFCASNPASCAETLAISLSFVSDSSYLIAGLGRDSFTRALATHAEGTEAGAGSAAVLVSGVFTIEVIGIPQRASIGRDFSLSIPIDGQMAPQRANGGLYCVSMDYEFMFPFVVSVASAPPGASHASCVVSYAGDYVIAQLADIRAMSTQPLPSYVGPRPGFKDPLNAIFGASQGGDSGGSVPVVAMFSATTALAILIWCAGCLYAAFTRGSEDCEYDSDYDYECGYDDRETSKNVVFWHKVWFAAQSQSEDRGKGTVSFKISSFPPSEGEDRGKRNVSFENSLFRGNRKVSFDKSLFAPPSSSLFGAVKRIPSRRASGRKCLHEAAATGDAAALKKALGGMQDGFGINAKDAHGSTALHLAASSGHRDAVCALLQHPGSHVLDVNACDESGRTPLHLCMKHGHPEVVEALLATRLTRTELRPSSASSTNRSKDDYVPIAFEELQSLDVGISDTAGWTPLHLAAGNGHAKGVQLLLQYINSSLEPGVAYSIVNRQNKSGWSALHLASVYGKDDVVECLLASPHCSVMSLKDSDGWLPIHAAVAFGHEGVVRLLAGWAMQNNRDIDVLHNNSGMSPLLLASKCGHTRIAKILLELNRQAYDCTEEAQEERRRLSQEALMQHARLPSQKKLAVIASIQDSTGGARS